MKRKVIKIMAELGDVKAIRWLADNPSKSKKVADVPKVGDWYEWLGEDGNYLEKGKSYEVSMVQAACMGYPVTFNGVVLGHWDVSNRDEFKKVPEPTTATSTDEPKEWDGKFEVEKTYIADSGIVVSCTGEGTYLDTFAGIIIIKNTIWSVGSTSTTWDKGSFHPCTIIVQEAVE